METSDVTLLDSNLQKLEYSIGMGKRVTWKIMENVIFSVVVKAVVLVFALKGMTELWAAIASDVGAMLLVTLNSMLLLPKRQTRAGVESMKGDIEEATGNRTNRSLARKLSMGSDSLTDEAATTECPLNENTMTSCVKKCCEPDIAKTAALVPEDGKRCAVGCCGSKDSGSDEVSILKCTLKEDRMKACARGCCGSDITKEAASASPEEKMCKKGCCASQEKTT